ncbi:hypothetical protein [Caballeronia sp. LZ035]|uniref:hypothetical protein n=1 Tax=Caballeronia sp. LZ035 TaxID=3038568 RepID=UPI002863C143|nr:hypothetical protein [Caballeronia sp. LZ035]MDR5761548.1 hypothetical protein [Caballeronia sp. LZ035]
MLEESLWSYETSGAGGGTFGDLALSSGRFILKSPEGVFHAYRYRGFGPGLGITRRVPEPIPLADLKLPRGKTGSATGSTTDFPGRGWVYRLHKPEFKLRDFESYTLYADASAGFLIAQGVTGLIVGISEKALVPWIFAPGLSAHAITASEKSVVILRGRSEGLIDGVGFGLFVGHVLYMGLC